MSAWFFELLYVLKKKGAAALATHSLRDTPSMIEKFL